jgi:two-component system, LuxR family, response regulator FixJ
MQTANPPVYIVDDDDAVRESLSFQLEALGYSVVAFASGVEFLDAAQTLAPGCVVLDVRMPEIDGPTVQQRLAERQLELPIVMITGHGDLPLAVRAMKAGAVDFIEKPFAEEMLIASIALAHERIVTASNVNDERDRATARLEPLSPRERDVLLGLIAGRQNKVIAYDLGISQRTVEVHRAHIMNKTQARSLSELVRLAIAAGLPLIS